MNRRRPSDNEIRRKMLTRIRADVELYGLSVIFVGDSPPFSYTVGRSKRGLPELLIVLPLHPEAGKTILNHLDQLMPSRLPSDTLVSVGGKYPVMLVDADIRAQRRYTLLASALNGDDPYQVQQVLLCDPEGRYPGDPECDLIYARQPILRPQPLVRLQ